MTAVCELINMVSKNEWAELEVDWSKIKEDLIEGSTVKKINAVEHPAKYPEKIILTICELAIKTDSFTTWVLRDEIQSRLETELKEQVAEYHRWNTDVKKWNPVDWFSASWTQINNDNSKLKEVKEVYERWMKVLEQKDKRSNTGKWEYRIKTQEDYDKIKGILTDIKKV